MLISKKIVTLNDMSELEPQAEKAIAAGDEVFDCTGVEQADSALLALILKWLESAQQKGLSPKIVNLPEGMWSLAKLYGVRELIRAYCHKDTPRTL